MNWDWNLALPIISFAALLSAGLTILGYYLRPPVGDRHALLSGIHHHFPIFSFHRGPPLKTPPLREGRRGGDERHFPNRTLVYICKPLTTILIFLLAVIPGSFLKDGYAFAIGAGLLFSLAGDIWEMLPRRHFLKALISFLFTHICYVLAFLSHPPGSAFLWPALPLGLICAAILAYLWPGLSDGMKAPVCVYVAVIGLMATLAVQNALEFPSGGTILAAVGALLFMLSDGALAVNRFRRPFHSAEAVILTSYFAGQLLIALSVGLRTGG
jgi:uncharacterized membrane protein YhhN